MAQVYEAICTSKRGGIHVHQQSSIVDRVLLSSSTSLYSPHCCVLHFRIYLRHCLHGPGFICNRSTFDAVKPFVYTAPIETGIKTGSF